MSYSRVVTFLNDERFVPLNHKGSGLKMSDYQIPILEIPFKRVEPPIILGFSKILLKHLHSNGSNLHGYKPIANKDGIIILWDPSVRQSPKDDIAAIKTAISNTYDNNYSRNIGMKIE